MALRRREPAWLAGVAAPVHRPLDLRAQPEQPHPSAVTHEQRPGGLVRAQGGVDLHQVVGAHGPVRPGRGRRRTIWRTVASSGVRPRCTRWSPVLSTTPVASVSRSSSLGVVGERLQRGRGSTRQVLGQPGQVVGAAAALGQVVGELPVPQQVRGGLADELGGRAGVVGGAARAAVVVAGDQPPQAAVLDQGHRHRGRDAHVGEVLDVHRGDAAQHRQGQVERLARAGRTLGTRALAGRTTSAMTRVQLVV